VLILVAHKKRDGDPHRVCAKVFSITPRLGG
jgi:hypothetical protein